MNKKVLLVIAAMAMMVIAGNAWAADPNITVKQAGGGDYDTIQEALDDVNGVGLAEYGVIEVQDNATYPENLLLFPDDVNFLTLQAGDGFSPTITLSGTDVNTHYIRMMSVGQTIQGFNINLAVCDTTTDGNSAMILSYGGAQTVRDCDITGPTAGWIRGIVNVATIEDTNVNNCYLGILCDINEVAAGFSFSITGSDIRDAHYRGVTFIDCNAVMDDCLVERCGGTLTNVGGCVIASDSNSSDPDGTLNLLITNSIIREALIGRNFNMTSIGTATIEDSIIMNTLGTATHNDEILQYRGTLNLTRCIISSGGPAGRIGVNMATPSSGQKRAICNIDHCDFWDTNSVNQWAATTSDPCHLMTVRNTIFTGEYGLLANAPDTIDSNWNDVFCDGRFGLNAVEGPNDLDVDPLYIQTDDASLDTFFALQPYSPVVNADSDGNYMGSVGPMAGYEDYLADLDGVHGIDFKDFAVLAQDWRVDNTIPAIPEQVLETFESYSATGGTGQVGTLLGPRVGGVPDSWREQVAWLPAAGWRRGSSTLTLIIGTPNDVNSGTRAMKWVYDVNVAPDINDIKFTEILVVLANEVNFDPYDELRVSLKRHIGNSPGSETWLYARFLNDIYGTYGKGGMDLTGPDRMDVANAVFGGTTLGMDPNEWGNWGINLDNLGNWTWGHNNLQHVGAIIFGIRTQSEGRYGHGTGTIDVDDIRLRDRPGCSGYPVGDLNEDCVVNFEDVKEFVYYWLMGK